MDGISKDDREEFLSTIQAELDKVERESTNYGAWPTDPRGIALKEELESHKEATKFLVSLVEGRRR